MLCLVAIKTHYQVAFNSWTLYYNQLKTNRWEEVLSDYHLIVISLDEL